MGGAHYTFRVSDELLIMKIEEFKRNGGNLSGLVNTLLRNYFNGEIQVNKFSKELLEIKKLQNEIQEWLEKARYFESKISEFEELLNEKQEKQQLEEQLPLIRKLREVVFDDIDELIESNGRVVNPEHAIKTRLSVFATEHNLSYPEARDLFFKAFPELNGRLEGVL